MDEKTKKIKVPSGSPGSPGTIETLGQIYTHMYVYIYIYIYICGGNIHVVCAALLACMIAWLLLVLLHDRK